MDYKRAVVIDTGPEERQQMKPLFGVEGEVRSKNDLTESALLEMSGNTGGLNSLMQHAVQTQAR